MTESGIKEKLTMVGALTTTLDEMDVGVRLAVMVAVTSSSTGSPSTLNVAWVNPGSMKSVAGTKAEGVLEVNVIASPGDGAGALSVIVATTKFPPMTFLVAKVRPVIAGGFTVTTFVT
jgi:hypothetical protein